MLRLKQLSLLCLQLIISSRLMRCTVLQPVGDALYDKEDVIKNVNWLCYKNSLNEFHTYSIENFEELVYDAEVFNPECETVLYIPGYDQALNADTTIAILTSYLITKQECPNICQFNYTHYSRQSIPKAFLAVDKVGAALSIMTEKLFNNGVDRNQFSCVGHSLGGQVCGALGRYTEPKIQSIIALDAAGPGFNIALKSVAKGQAQCVVCVRTDEGVYGIKLTECDIDVYPNGGRRYQPGCPKDAEILSFTPEDFCSHHRSVNITASAILHPDLFLLVKCETVKPRKRQTGYKCDDENPIELTELLPKCLNENLRGKFYFTTSGKKPYGLGAEGAKKETFIFL